MKKKMMLLALPILLMSACSQDKKPESSQDEALTEEAEGKDPQARSQEYTGATYDDKLDTIDPVKSDSIKSGQQP